MVSLMVIRCGAAGCRGVQFGISKHDNSWLYSPVEMKVSVLHHDGEGVLRVSLVTHHTSRYAHKVHHEIIEYMGIRS